MSYNTVNGFLLAWIDVQSSAFNSVLSSTFPADNAPHVAGFSVANKNYLTTYLDNDLKTFGGIPTFTSNDFRVGINRGQGVPFKGYIHEVVTYQGVNDLGSAKNIMKYLSDKWSI